VYRACTIYVVDEKCIQHFGCKNSKFLSTPKHRWKGQFKIDLKEIEFVGVNCIHMTQSRNVWLAVLKT
jgi:hypothetical protein